MFIPFLQVDVLPALSICAWSIVAEQANASNHRKAVSSISKENAHIQ
jgi:hypothetical protein